STANSCEAQIAPASNSSAASRIVTPQTFSLLVMAQSSDEGPRSPLMPGCTIRQRWRDQTSSGMAIFSIGAMIRSGTSRETVAIISSSVAATQTEISWPRSPSSIHRRWLRLLWAEVKKRIRMGFLLIFFVNRNEPEPVFLRVEAEGAAKGEAQNHFLRALCSRGAPPYALS